MCSPPPPLLPRTDNLKFWLVGHHDLNPPHHHDNSSSQPPTSVWNLKWFFLDVGVSAVQISQSCSSSERGTDFILHLSFFFLVSHQVKASMSWKKLNQMWWRMLFSLFGHFQCFFFFHMQYFVRGMFWSFNALPLFQHHTRCLKRVPRKPD